MRNYKTSQFVSPPAAIRCLMPLAIVFSLALLGAAQSQPAQTQPQATKGATIAKLQVEAKDLRTLVHSELANHFLDAVVNLPAIDPRTLYFDKATRKWLTSEQAAALTEEQHKQLQVIPADEALYYQTKYGSPLAYSRPVEVLGNAGLHDFAGKKILDFGYGTIGHLRMLASLGADVVGVDVDPLLTMLYNQPSDTGKINEGKITLVEGRFSDDKIKSQVGNAFDLIISKNTLKRGYLHPPPDVQVDKRKLLDLGLSDEEFLKLTFTMLKPGGKFLIYNISPAPAPPDKPYIPWADGRCPFEKEMLEKVGFQIVMLDKDDSEAVREMAKALKWDSGDQPMNLQDDLFAHYTLLEKRP